MESQKFYDLLIDIRKLYVDEMNQLLSDFHMTTSSWVIFKSIVNHAPTTLVAVAKERNIEKPTATKIIHKLIEMQLIESNVGADRRERILTVTDKGNTLFTEIQSLIHIRQLDSLAEVEHYDQLIAQLQKIHIYYKERKDDASAN